MAHAHAQNNRCICSTTNSTNNIDTAPTTSTNSTNHPLARSLHKAAAALHPPWATFCYKPTQRPTHHRPTTSIHRSPQDSRRRQISNSTTGEAPYDSARPPPMAPDMPPT
eukprot:5736997-Pyramimonas_sp.AAC.1